MSVVLTIDFATLFRIVPPVIGGAKPILIRGKHGVGKSEVVYEIAKCLVWDETTQNTVFTEKGANGAGLPVVERRASQMTEGDLVGLPVINGNRTSFNPPDWFKEACEKPVVLFMDEVDRATVEVRQGFFELTDSRKLNGHSLHPGTRIFAAVNGGKYAQQYQVGEMDPAELDRWTVFDVEPNVEDWMKWATSEKEGKKNVHPTIVEFMNSNRNHLEHLSEYEPNKKYPSRRSWKRASDVLSLTGYLDEYNKDIIPLASAFVGMEAAIDLEAFIKNAKKNVTAEDIIKKGKWKETEKFGLNEHNALIQKIEQSNLLANKLTEKQLDNFAKYFVTLPAEPRMLCFKIVGKAGNRDNVVNFYKHEFDLDGKTVKVNDMIRDILTPEVIEKVSSEKK